MKHARTIALVLLTACGARSSKEMYVAAPTSVAMAEGGQLAAPPPAVDGTGGDTHVNYGVNPWVETSVDHLSTFAADVDTASYTYARRTLQGGALPSEASVRVEEFVNYFEYAFPQPQAGSPFSVIMDAAPSPLAPDHYVVRVGVAAPAKDEAQRKSANLVFLVDVSGSMDSDDKLGLAKRSLKILVNNLKQSDTVALVTYAGNTRVVLPATSVENKAKILAAIDDLNSSGSTAMGAGLDLAYEEAMKGLGGNRISRVIVLSDGDTNVGPTTTEEILTIIDARKKAGVTLSTIGFGMGNYRADLMEQLGDKGNGNNYYLDSDEAAEKLFTKNLASVLEVAAKDAKLQVDFDPAVVARYRLVGYENRDIADADFRRDAVDAGEIGVGHQVTALYEVQLIDTTKPLGLVRIRHKAPDGQEAMESTYAMAAAPAASFDASASDLRFAYAVAAFADLLRGAEDAQAWSLDDILAVAKSTAGNQPDRMELIGLMEKARSLRGPKATVAR